MKNGPFSRTGGFRSAAMRYNQPLCAVVAPAARRWRRSGERLDDEIAATGPHARSGPVARLEAVLLLCDQPEGSRRIAQLTGLADGTKARTLVRALNRLYDSEGCSFRVEEVAGGFQLLTRQKFAPWLRRLHGTPPEVRLSVPAMETLAVVAYRQPVVRAEIEAIRGVQCGEILRQLIERDLVRIAGRSDELGRPFMYGTTKHFLQVFGLRHLDELPRPEMFYSNTSGETDNTTSDQPGTGENDITDQRQEDEETNVTNDTPLNEEDQPLDETDLPVDEDEEEAFGDEDEFEYEDDEDEYEDEEEYYDEDDDEEDDEEYEYYEEDDDEYEDEDEEEDEDEPWEEVDDEDVEEEWDEDEDEEEDEDEDEDEEWEYEEGDEDEDLEDEDEYEDEDEDEEEWEDDEEEEEEHD